MLANLSNIKFENEHVKEEVIKEIKTVDNFHFFTYLNGDLAYIWIFEEEGEYFYRIEDEDGNLINYDNEILIEESHLKQY